MADEEVGIVVKFDTSGVSKGTEKGGKAVKGFAGRARGALKKLKLAFGTLGKAIFVINQAIDLAKKVWSGFRDVTIGVLESITSFAERSAQASDAMLELGRRSGSTTEFVSRFSFAARQADVSSEQLRVGLVALTRRAAAMPKNFERWGISVRDVNGVIKDTETLTFEVSDRMRDLGTAAERAALGDDLLSEAGRQLVPLLSQGSEGLEKMFERSDKLGATISQTAALIADEFNNELGAARDAMGAVSREAGAVFQPAMIKVFELVQESAGTFLQIINENRDSMAELATKGIALVVDGFALLLKVLVDLGFVMRPFVALIDQEGARAFEKLRLGAREVAKEASLLANSLRVNADTIMTGVVPAVQAENRERSSLVQTLKTQTKLTKSLSVIAAESEIDALEAAETAENAAFAIFNTKEKLSIKDVELARQTALDQANIAKRAAKALMENEAELDGAGVAASAARKKRIQLDAQLQVRESQGVAKQRDVVRLQDAIEEERLAGLRLRRSKQERKELIANAEAASAGAIGAAKELQAVEAAFDAQEIERIKKREEAEKRREAAAKKRREAEKRAAEQRREENEQSIKQAIQMGAAFGDALSRAAMEAESVGDFFKQAGQAAIALAKQVIMAKAAEAAASAFAAHSSIPFLGIIIGAAFASAAFSAVSAFVGSFATGGMVPATGMALVHEGEFVVPAPVVQEITRREGGGGGGGVTNVFAPMQLLAPPNQTQVDQHFQDSVVPAFERAKDNRRTERPDRRVIGRQ